MYKMIVERLVAIAEAAIQPSGTDRKLDCRRPREVKGQMESEL